MLKKFNETERLKEVNSYKIEDTLTEKEYDDVAFLASSICGTPIALVTLLYEDRQWFKAAVGTDLKENKRELSFCTHAIAGAEDVMQVENANRDVRFMHNPMVQGGPKLVFYAGAPIVNKNGYSLGTVCVYDVVEKSLSDEQKKGLKILSEQVMGLLELRKQNMQLEETVNVRTEELRKNNIQLEHTIAELTSFTFVASHDLQEPLRKIHMFSKHILESENFSNSKTQDYFNRIISASDRMQNLIHSLLDFSRTNVNDLIFEPCDLNVIVEESKDDLQLTISEKQAVVEYENLPTINGLPVQLYQLFTNVIDNALKYSNPEIKPHIKITASIEDEIKIVNNASDHQKKYYAIKIEDNGIGFEKKFENKIFELFQRLHGRMEYSGTGIGLAIVKKIVTNHKGFITAEGNLNIGSIFTIYFPTSW